MSLFKKLLFLLYKQTIVHCVEMQIHAEPKILTQYLAFLRLVIL